MKSVKRFILAGLCAASGFSAQALAQYTPTISGVSAFWYLGPGITSDGGVCSSPPQYSPSSSCFWATSQLTANANGAPGDPVFSVVQSDYPESGGRVTFSCMSCANPIITAQSPSGGLDNPACTSDIQIYVTYGGVYTSPAFNVTIAVPRNNGGTLQSGYPTAGYYPNSSAGWADTWKWSITDSCGGSPAGLDLNEAFGSFQDLASNNWGYPTATGGYLTAPYFFDVLGQYPYPGLYPTPQNYGTSGTAVLSDYPWTTNVGSLASGQGTPVETGTQEWYTDHGQHY